LADTSGNVTPSNSTSYDSFGNSSNANFPTRYQFTGREFDNFSGLHYYRARFYDGNLGRFISEDPSGFEGGDVNLYGYVWNNPLTYTDSMGLDAEYDQQLWRAQQDLIEAVEPAIEFGAGFGDTVLFGASRSLRQWQGIDSPLLDCSTSYQAGEWTAIAIQVAEAGVGIYRAGLKLAPKLAARRSFNPFKGKTPQQIENMFLNKGFRPSGPDPISGNGGYVSPSGRSFHIDPTNYGRFREPPHVDANRPRKYRGPLEKRKFNY
jgi:RHS repeat-associated protein